MQVMIELVINHTSDQHPWFQGRAACAARFARTRDVRVVATRTSCTKACASSSPTPRSPTGRGTTGQGLLLASLLLAPAGPQLRQSARDGRGAERDALLARHGRGRAAPGRDPLPGRARRHELRKRAGDARQDQADPRGDRRRVRQPPDPRRGEHVAGRRAAVLRRRRRVPHGVPLPADAAHLHGAAPGRSAADHRHHGADAGHSRRPASGGCSCATTTS